MCSKERVVCSRKRQFLSKILSSLFRCSRRIEEQGANIVLWVGDVQLLTKIEEVIFVKWDIFSTLVVPKVS